MGEGVTTDQRNAENKGGSDKDRGRNTVGNGNIEREDAEDRDRRWTQVTERGEM